MDREGPAAAGRASRAAWRLTMIWLLVLGWPLGVAAQTETGRLTGTVTDATGGVLPGVTVTVKGAGGAVRTVTTDASGRFVVDQVAPGSYELDFELSGFTGQTRTAVVTAGQSVEFEIRLEIGGRAEAIQVTGTLIPRPTLEAMSPVTTLEVEELTYRGITRLEDLLTTLPQVFTAQNSTVSNGSAGTATVNLRNMGDSRTLILLDGRRMASGDPWDVSPDLNFIPSALVKRVDVLTGGASAVYGPDAVAGVVNFILDRDFTGVRGGVQISGFQHDNRNTLARQMNAAIGFSYPKGNIWNDGPIDFNFAFGSKFADGKGHAAFYLDYRSTSAITKDQRDYTNCSVGGLSGVTMNGPVCGGSTVIPAGQFIVYESPTRFQKYILDLNPTTDPTGDRLRPFRTSDVWNYAPYNFMQRPDKRWAGGAFMNYDRNRYLNLYGDVMFMTDVTDSQIAPSGDFGTTTQLNCDNPMLSAQQVQLLCTDMGYGPNDTAFVLIRRRSVESGPRINHMEHNSLRFSAGARGDINNVWKYDAYALQAEVHAPWSFDNDFDIEHLQNALLVTGTRGQPGTWQCINDATSCVPWNIFKAGGVTEEALNYLTLKEVENGGTRTRVVSGKVSGDLKAYALVSPAAVEGVKVAVGAEYRQEFLYVDADSALEQGLGAGAGGATPSLRGVYSVKELFAEGLVPLVQNHWLVKDLGLEAGYRLSHYNTTGSHSAYKLQASWAPTPDLKFRVGYNRATRSPNVQEMYAPQSLYLGGSVDICAGATPTATLAQCRLTGVTPAQYGNIPENAGGLYYALSGGNLNLKPEVADTWTGGLVVTPRRYVPGFTLALDYFHIKLNDTIGSLGYEDIMNGCAAGRTALCAFIHRDQLGSLWLTRNGYIETNNQNVGVFLTEGLDVNATYTRPIGELGVVSASLIGSVLMKDETNTGLFDYDCAGYFGNTCWNPLPRWRHLARFSWETTHGVTVSVGWRLLGHVTIDYASPNPYLAQPEYAALARASNIYEIPTTNYLDLGVTWKIRKGIQFVAGCNNVFDKEPPLAPGMIANDTATGFFGTYDPLGRYIHVGLQFTF